MLGSPRTQCVASRNRNNETSPAPGCTVSRPCRVNDPDNAVVVVPRMPLACLALQGQDTIKPRAEPVASPLSATGAALGPQASPIRVVVIHAVGLLCDRYVVAVRSPAAQQTKPLPLLSPVPCPLAPSPWQLLPCPGHWHLTTGYCRCCSAPRQQRPFDWLARVDRTSAPLLQPCCHTRRTSTAPLDDTAINATMGTPAGTAQPRR